MDKETFYSRKAIGRATGQTTRIIDACVQEAFENGRTICIDHYFGDREHGEASRGTQGRLSKMIADKVARRILAEHGIDKCQIKVAKTTNGSPFYEVTLTL